MRYNSDINGLRGDASAAQLDRLLQSRVDHAFYVSLKSPTEVAEHRGSAGQDNVLERPKTVDALSDNVNSSTSFLDRIIFFSSSIFRLISFSNFRKVTLSGERATTHVVKWSPNVDWTRLDASVHNFRNGSCEIGVRKLGMEKNLGSQETLVADIDAERLLRDAVHALVLQEPLVGLFVVFRKFPSDVGADVAVPLFYGL